MSWMCPNSVDYSDRHEAVDPVGASVSATQTILISDSNIEYD